MFAKLPGNDVRRYKNALLHMTKLMLAVAVTVVFSLVWFVYYAEILYKPYYGKGNLAVIGLFFMLYILFARTYGGFQVGLVRISELVYSQGVALLITGGLMYVVVWLLVRHLPNPFPLMLALLISFVLTVLWAKLANRLNSHLFPPRRTLIVYDGQDALDSVQSIFSMVWKFHVVDCISIRQGMDTVLDKLGKMDAVFVCGVASSDRNQILKYCIENDIQAYLRPKIGDLLVSSAKRIHLSNVPVLYCARSNASMWYLGTKRILDLLVAVLALAILWPLMAITALIIKLYDGGPIFYKQYRLTKDGHEFLIYKFRSMQQDAEKDGVARLAIKHDNRITPIGKLIRAIRFDELPQLINVLKGDMSLVGPRPERPEISAQYEQEIPEFRLRLQVKAGLTGYAQVYGKYNTNPYDKLQMDLMYIANQSIVQDIKLVMCTIKTLFWPESTEGVKNGQVTAGSV